MLFYIVLQFYGPDFVQIVDNTYIFYTVLHNSLVEFV